jgi:hypothetical protein
MRFAAVEPRPPTTGACVPEISGFDECITLRHLLHGTAAFAINGRPLRLGGPR